MLERLEQWVLTDVWLPPSGLQSKGGSPRRRPDAQNIANHGRLMAYVYERTQDPLFLVLPQEMAAAGFGAGANRFGTRATGLVFNYLPWFLATLAANGNPQADRQIEISFVPASLRLAHGGNTSLEVTLKNNGTSAVESLQVSLHSRLDIGIIAPSGTVTVVPPGQAATYRYAVEAPANLNASCDYNRLAYVHLSAVYRRAGQACVAHRWIKLELDSAEPLATNAPVAIPLPAVTR